MHQSIQQTTVVAGGLDCGPPTKLTDDVAETEAPWQSLLQKIGKFVELTEKISEVDFFIIISMYYAKLIHHLLRYIRMPNWPLLSYSQHIRYIPS